ncbi:dihydroxyacetone kinase subunit L [Klebsiella pneumoniae]|nr:dihydroxyacetone kinase subunit L [Klebsiella pneumoniae]
MASIKKRLEDADHGPTCTAVSVKWSKSCRRLPIKILGFIPSKTPGMTLLSNVGGASGPLFGTFFIRAAQVTQAHQSLTLDELYLMIREGADGVVNRGKAEPGDKTMCDVWLPVVDSLRQSSEQHLSIAAAMDAACEVAERAAHATITMQARKGRASYLGERSIGHQDPGATSVLFMVQMLAAAAKE